MKTSIKHILSLAALALLTAACSSEDITQQQTASESALSLPFRATIGSPAGTRGLSAPASDAADITAKWVAGEKIALVHNNTVDAMKVASVDNDGNATITGTITNYDENETAYLVYYGCDPAINDDMTDYKGMLTNALGEAAAYTPEIIAKTFVAAVQGGTLESLSKESDFRLGTSALTKKGDYVTLTTSPTLESQFAIWRLTLTTDGTNALAATQLDVKDADDNTIASATIDPAASEFYVLLPPTTSATNYVFWATAASGNYSCTASNVTLGKGSFYLSKLTVKKKDGSISFGQTSVEKTNADTAFKNDTFTITEGSDGTVTYSSSDTKVATVNVNTGEVTIVGPGTATITATVTDGPYYTYAVKTAEYTLTVKPTTDIQDYTSGTQNW